MRNKLLWLLLAIASVTQAASLDTKPPVSQLKPLQEQSQAAHLSAEVLTRYHYRSVPLDDATSSKIFDNYVKALDGEKVFFTQADIDQFESARTSLDDAILDEDLSIPFAIYNLYQQRITERINYARSLLKTGFEFESRESYHFAREKGAWA